MKKQHLLIFSLVAIVIAIVAFFTSAHAEVATMASMGIAGFSGEGVRNVFDKTKAENPGKSIVPGYLRCDVKIINGQNVYEFNFTRDNRINKAREQKLDRGNKFKITQIGYFLIKEDSTIEGTEVLQTYPNATVFADDATNFIGSHLEVFYNGKVSFKIGSTVYLESLGTEIFRNVGAMAKSSATTASERNNANGFFAMTPQITLDANDAHSITVEAPITTAHKVANTNANTNNYIAVILRGYLIK